VQCNELVGIKFFFFLKKKKKISNKELSVVGEKKKESKNQRINKGCLFMWSQEQIFA